MTCTVSDLRYKEMINLHNGHRLGYVADVLMSLEDGKISALIVPGQARFFGLFGREEDMIVPWDNITKIGEDIILIDMEGTNRRSLARENKGWSF